MSSGIGGCLGARSGLLNVGGECVGGLDGGSWDLLNISCVCCKEQNIMRLEVSEIFEGTAI